VGLPGRADRQHCQYSMDDTRYTLLGRRWQTLFNASNSSFTQFNCDAWRHRPRRSRRSCAGLRRHRTGTRLKHHNNTTEIERADHKTKSELHVKLLGMIFNCILLKLILYTSVSCECSATGLAATTARVPFACRPDWPSCPCAVGLSIQLHRFIVKQKLKTKAMNAIPTPR
jgi:hypothetical protein